MPLSILLSGASGLVGTVQSTTRTSPDAVG